MPNFIIKTVQRHNKIAINVKLHNFLLFYMQIINLSGFIMKVSFTACHLDKLYLAFASSIDTLTCPKRIFNEQDWLQLQAKAVLRDACQLKGALSPYHTLYVMWQF